MPDHRAERAWQRYGLALSREDIDHLAAQAVPANRIRSTPSGDVHAIFHGPDVLFAVVSSFGKERVITTFLPPDTFSRSNRRDARRKAVTKAGKPAAHRRAERLQDRFRKREAVA